MLSTTRKSPFPWLPMAAISIGLVSHSYALSSLFPYIGYMVQYLGVTDDKDEAGFYAGYVSSALMVGRSSYFWGRFADRYRRLPVMYISLCSMVVLSIAFGMSTSFYWAVACRFLLGAMNGLVGTSKTMISEVCIKEHEMVGMGTITGLVGGPGIGGLLSEPAKHYPRYFSEFGLFGRQAIACEVSTHTLPSYTILLAFMCGRFPYLLPNVVGACIALVGLPMVFFLHETKPTNGFKPLSTSDTDIEDAENVNNGPVVATTPLTQNNSLDYDIENSDINIATVEKSMCTQRSSSITTVVDDTDDDNREAMNTIWLPKETERVVDNSDSEGRDVALQDYERGINHGGNNFCAVKAKGEAESGDVGRACWTECLVPIRLLSERKVRGILFAYGLLSFFKMGFDEVYPLWALSTIAKGWPGLDHEAYREALLVFQMVIYPPLIKMVDIQRLQRVMSFLMIPFFIVTPLLSFLHLKGWVLIAANLVILCVINISANTIFINVALAINNAVDPSRRGTLNGISMATGSLAKAAGPPFFAVVYAWSIEYPHPFPFDYQLVFDMMAMLMAVLIWSSCDAIRIHKMRRDAIEKDGVTIATDKEAGIGYTSHIERQ